MCKEGAYWGKTCVALCNMASSTSKYISSIKCISLSTLTGAIGGVYVGTEYGVERIRGTRDWVILSIGSLKIL